ncbi:transporter substrate-binding domain-containing protein [Brevibacillus sp. H7]|uniref:transporter substrate-binding domain-containing protein n=1 Tax=Brevibacillus sp. H7 TaxID=3349138 RepID=UPI00382F0C6F
MILVRADEQAIKGVEDLKGKVIATKQGTASYDYSTKIEGVGKVVPFPNIDQAYMELEKGSADAVIFDSPNIQYYIKTKGEGKVKAVGDLLQGQQFAIAFPKGSELRQKVDAALEKLMQNGTYDQLYEKWFGEKPKK